jgi:GTP:adenosylcobinamide-phosphate guanylyltransferase
MYAIITAGGNPQPEDPLYSYSKGDSKALIDVAGKPMVQWVLDALNEAREVDNIIMIGLSNKSGLVSKKPIHYISNQGRMLANIVAGVDKALELDPQTEYVLLVSSDIPALKGDMVDWLIKTCRQTKNDLYYGVCPREVMEGRFPGSKRTYTHLKDVDVCGADMNITHVRMATEHLDLWEQLIGNRKSPMRQASLVGLSTFWKLLTRSATLDELVEHVCGRLGIDGRAIVWEHAEPCMDIDKPHQLELLRADMEKQQVKEKKAPKVRKTPPIVVAQKAPAAKVTTKKTAVKAKPISKVSPKGKTSTKKTVARKPTK